MSLLAGFQNYFMVALTVALLASAGAAISYRYSYLTEQHRRAEIEASLQQTVAAFDSYKAMSKAAIDAVTRAETARRSLADDRRTAREKVLNTSNDQDGPVAPVLRDVVNGVR